MELHLYTDNFTTLICHSCLTFYNSKHTHPHLSRRYSSLHLYIHLRPSLLIPPHPYHVHIPTCRGDTAASISPSTSDPASSSLPIHIIYTSPPVVEIPQPPSLHPPPTQPPHPSPSISYTHPHLLWRYSSLHLSIHLRPSLLIAPHPYHIHNLTCRGDTAASISPSTSDTASSSLPHPYHIHIPTCRGDTAASISATTFDPASSSLPFHIMYTSSPVVAIQQPLSLHPPPTQPPHPSPSISYKHTLLSWRYSSPHLSIHLRPSLLIPPRPYHIHILTCRGDIAASISPSTSDPASSSLPMHIIYTSSPVVAIQQPPSLHPPLTQPPHPSPSISYTQPHLSWRYSSLHLSIHLRPSFLISHVHFRGLAFLFFNCSVDDLKQKILHQSNEFECCTHSHSDGCFHIYKNSKTLTKQTFTGQIKIY